MLTSTAQLVLDHVDAGDRLPVGCAVLVAILLSLLLWAILAILLWRLFDAQSFIDFRQNIKRRLVIRSCFSAIYRGRRWIAAAGLRGSTECGQIGLVSPAQSGAPSLNE